MDSVYEINAAKAEFREAYNAGDVARLLACFHDNAVNMSEAFPTARGVAGKKQLKERAEELFAKYSVRLVPIVNDILPCGDKMFDYGWHEFTLSSKVGGPPVQTRQRYMELWSKDAAGEWKICFYMNNRDVRLELNGVLATWFLDQQPVPAST